MAVCARRLRASDALAMVEVAGARGSDPYAVREGDNQGRNEPVARLPSALSAQCAALGSICAKPQLRTASPAAVAPRSRAGLASPRRRGACRAAWAVACLPKGGRSARRKRRDAHSQLQIREGGIAHSGASLITAGDGLAVHVVCCCRVCACVLRQHAYKEKKARTGVFFSPRAQKRARSLADLIQHTLNRRFK